MSKRPKRVKGGSQAKQSRNEKVVGADDNSSMDSFIDALMARMNQRQLLPEMAAATAVAPPATYVDPPTTVYPPASSSIMLDQNTPRVEEVTSPESYISSPIQSGTSSDCNHYGGILGHNAFLSG